MQKFLRSLRRLCRRRIQIYCRLLLSPSRASAARRQKPIRLPKPPMTSPASSPRRPHDRPMRHPFKFPHHLRKKGATRDRSPRYHLRRRVRPLPSPSPPRPRLRRNREAFIPAPSYAQASIVSHIWYVPPRSLSRCASVPHRRNHVPAGGQDTGCSAFENGRGQPRRDVENHRKGRRTDVQADGRVRVQTVCR